MIQKTLSIVLIAMLGGAACSTDMEQTMSLDAAQKASGKAAEEVRVADINGDQLIDAAEFAALTVVPEAADVTEGANTPAGK
jgi:hypothetical protein